MIMVSRSVTVHTWCTRYSEIVELCKKFAIAALIKLDVLFHQNIQRGCDFTEK